MNSTARIPILKRGVWMLERMLHDPPPPPPPNVPEVDLADPEIAKMTLKERIADHRDDPACYLCHARIDPGIAFENYDDVILPHHDQGQAGGRHLAAVQQATPGRHGRSEGIPARRTRISSRAR